MGEIIQNKTKGRISRFAGILSLFAGIESLSMICSLIRAKFISIWIGAVGVGLNAVLLQTSNLFSMVFQYGLRNSGVREMSASKENMADTFAGIRKLSLTGGLAAAVLCLALSWPISRMAFGNGQHAWQIALLAPAIFFGAISSGEFAAMQSLGRLKRIARASVCSVISSTIVALPMFKWLGLDSIVWVVNIFFAFSAFWAWIYRVKDYREGKAPEIRKIFRVYAPLIKLALWLTASAFISSLCAYIFTLWLNYNASTETLGMYQAGFTVLNTYMGVLFSALALEFYPRLSRTRGITRRIIPVVTEQTSLITLTSFPAALVLIAFAEIVVRMLYSSEFMSITPMLRYGAPGVVARAFSYCLAYVMLVKGDGRVFMVTELTSGLISVLLNIFFFSFMGYEGLGIAYTLWYTIYAGMMTTVCARRYRMTLSASRWAVAGVCYIIACVFAVLISGIAG